MGPAFSIWSFRFSVARGLHARKERTAADEQSADLWLDIFRKDEPNIVFCASVRKPRAELIERAIEEHTL